MNLPTIKSAFQIKNFFALSFLMLLLVNQVFAQENKPVRLFLIGNSFSQNASRYLPQITKEGGDELIIGRAELGGCPLQRHWESVVANDADPNNPKGRPYKGKSLRELLSGGHWDVVSIQQYSLLSGDSNSYEPYAKNLVNFIREIQKDAKVVIHQTWAYRADAKNFGKINGADRAKDQKEMWVKSREAYHHLAKTLNLRIIPVGDAFQKVNSDPKFSFKKDESFNVEQAVYPALPNQQHSLNIGYHYSKAKKLAFDPNHANEAGSYLAGLVWYQFLFKADPTKVKFRPEMVDQEFGDFLKQTAKSFLQK